MEFSRQEYRSGLPCPSPGIFSTQGSNLGLPHCWQIFYQLSHRSTWEYWFRHKCPLCFVFHLFLPLIHHWTEQFSWRIPFWYLTFCSLRLRIKTLHRAEDAIEWSRKMELKLQLKSPETPTWHKNTILLYFIRIQWAPRFILLKGKTNLVSTSQLTIRWGLEEKLWPT